MIGIIGFGFVGKAVAKGFPYTDHMICDPKYFNNSIEDVVGANPDAIFVCLPTPTDDTEYVILKDALTLIKSLDYKGITVVKSTILPHHIEDFDIVLNPEFLSRATADEDFINPPFVLFGGPKDKTEKLYDIYSRYSVVNMSKVMMTDVKTASLAKYTFNTFYSTKLIFMNQLYDVCEKVGVDFEELKDVLKLNPWMMGVSHLDVPGHEGRGFSGPCLPKDTEAFAREFGLELLSTVLELNTRYREESTNGSN